MSKQPAVKPKVQAKTSRNAGSSSKKEKNGPAEKEKEETNADTSKDEELARMLQEEMFNEQEESDAALARRLQEEEQNKRRLMVMPPRSRPHPAPGGRPMSATPIQQLFHALFHMRPQTTELEDDDNEETTPAMEVEPVPGATGITRGRGRPTFGIQNPFRSPERTVENPDTNRFRIPGGTGIPGRVMPRRSSSDTIVPSDPTSDDLLPGVRVNPNRRRLDHNPFRRRVFFNMDPENTEVEEEETQGDGQPAGAERRLVPPPGLGPREGTMPPPDGEYEPDLMILDSPTERTREDNFVHIMRDPFLLMLLLMGRDPTFMVPDDIDLGDYEALWDLAERLGEVQSRGMKEEEIGKLKTETYRRKRPSDKDGEPEKCSVCLYEFKTGDKCINLPCGHTYHQECLTEWLTRNASCPVCRQDVRKTTS